MRLNEDDYCPLCGDIIEPDDVTGEVRCLNNCKEANLRTSECHEILKDGKGKCSVPMWCMGLPAGFCDEPAFGKQEPGQRRYGDWTRGKWYDGYCSGLACYSHGGPKCPGIDLGDGNFSGCNGKGGDCPTCGK